jgi:nitroimidazol reductase NimA-like FMN-containing flavoprotein (pyridoxamine 5'-phosphate oxidase superfamily)
VIKEARGVLEELEPAQCLELIASGGVGRIAFVSRYDLTVFPVNYRLVHGAILFRTAPGGLADEDLRTGIAHADYQVAFEVDDMDEAAREGWSVLIQGPAHHLEDAADIEAARSAGVQSWASGPRDHFVRITPVRITGRRIRQSA